MQETLVQFLGGEDPLERDSDWKIEKQLGMFLKKNNEIFNSYMAQEPSNCIHTAPN